MLSTETKQNRTVAGRGSFAFKKLGVKEQEFAFMELRSRGLGRTEAFQRLCLSQGNSSLKSQNLLTLAMAMQLKGEPRRW